VTESFSALQRAEIAEITTYNPASFIAFPYCFSALQRAEIAEIRPVVADALRPRRVSVLFNEPKLLKYPPRHRAADHAHLFQCSSTSRNC